MTWSRVLLVTVALLAAVAGPLGRAQAGDLTDQVATDIARLFRTLEDPDLKGRGEERREAVRAITREVFDVTEMAERTLGRHWQGRSAAEREEFVRLLAALVDAQVMMLESHAGERIDFVGELVSGARGAVRSRVAARNGQGLVIDYRLVDRAGRWLIYDVVVDGVSMVDNYRSQFQRVIRTASYEILVRKMSQ